jgi:hypothetical protein
LLKIWYHETAAGCKNANDTMPNPKTTATSKCRETEDKKQVVAVLKGHGE